MFKTSSKPMAETAGCPSTTILLFLNKKTLDCVPHTLAIQNQDSISQLPLQVGAGIELKYWPVGYKQKYQAPTSVNLFERQIVYLSLRFPSPVFFILRSRSCLTCKHGGQSPYYPKTWEQGLPPREAEQWAGSSMGKSVYTSPDHFLSRWGEPGFEEWRESVVKWVAPDAHILTSFLFLFCLVFFYHASLSSLSLSL